MNVDLHAQVKISVSLLKNAEQQRIAIQVTTPYGVQTFGLDAEAAYVVGNGLIDVADRMTTGLNIVHHGRVTRTDGK